MSSLSFYPSSLPFSFPSQTEGTDCALLSQNPALHDSGIKASLPHPDFLQNEADLCRNEIKLDLVHLPVTQEAV